MLWPKGHRQSRLHVRTISLRFLGIISIIDLEGLLANGYLENPSLPAKELGALAKRAPKPNS